MIAPLNLPSPSPLRKYTNLNLQNKFYVSHPKWNKTWIQPKKNKNKKRYYYKNGSDPHSLRLLSSPWNLSSWLSLVTGMNSIRIRLRRTKHFWIWTRRSQSLPRRGTENLSRDVSTLTCNTMPRVCVITVTISTAAREMQRSVNTRTRWSTPKTFARTATSSSTTRAGNWDNRGHRRNITLEPKILTNE